MHYGFNDKTHMKINIREIELKDIDLVADYWFTSKPDHLVGMGVDLDKLPTREALTNTLIHQVNSSLTDKSSYALIWEIDGKPSGHTNINQIKFGEKAFMHLHLWNPGNRRKGIGSELVQKSLSYFFDNFELKELYCEPYALNPAPNNTLKKIGFEFIKTYRTIPGTLNFEQEVNQWKMTKEVYLIVTGKPKR